MITLDTIKFRVFGKDHIFHLPISIVQQKLLTFEREKQHLGRVEFEIFPCKNNTHIIVVHTKEGLL